MNLGDARTAVRDYLNEEEAKEWTDARLNRLIAEANYDVAHELMAASDFLFAKKYRITYPANAISVDLATIVPAAGGTLDALENVIAVFILNDNADPSSTNRPLRVEPEHHVAELFRVSTDSGRHSTARALKWMVIEDDLYLTPFSDKSRTVWIWIAPVIFEPTTDAQELLSTDSGSTTNYRQWQELVVLLAAARAKGCVDDNMSAVWGLYQHKLSLMHSIVRSTRNRMSPKKTRL